MNKGLIFFLITICFFPVDHGKAQDILIPYRDGDKWGYADTSHNIVITPNYDKLSRTSQNGLFVVENELKKGVINIKNELVLDTEFTWMSVSQKFIRAQAEFGFKLYTHEGKPILETHHYLDRIINDSLILVRVKNDKVGLLYLESDTSKIWLLDSTYSSFPNFYKKNEITGIRDDILYNFSLNGTKVSKTSEQRVDKETLEEEEPEFIGMSLDDDYVEKKTKRKIVTSFEHVLKSCKILDYHYLIVEVTKISQEGREVVKQDTLETPYSSIIFKSKPRHTIPEYERLLWENERISFRNRAIVIDAIGLKGIVNGEGSYILDCEFEDIHEGTLRYATDTSKHYIAYICSKNGKWGVVAKGNKKILDFEYQSIKTHLPLYNYDIREGIVCVKNGKYGIIGLDGKNSVPFEMDFIGKDRYRKCFLLEKDKKYGAFDGTNTCAPIYESSAFTIKYFGKYPVLGFVENRKIIGYGDFQGRKFFKDK